MVKDTRHLFTSSGIVLVSSWICQSINCLNFVTVQMIPVRHTESKYFFFAFFGNLKNFIIDQEQKQARNRQTNYRCTLYKSH